MELSRHFSSHTQSSEYLKRWNALNMFAVLLQLFKHLHGATKNGQNGRREGLSRFELITVEKTL